MNTLKTIISSTFLFVAINTVLIAQSADERIAILLNSGDWFSLEEEYSGLKDEMQSDMLKNYAEAIVGYYFNQPDMGINAIEWLLSNAQEEIGFENVCNMILLKCEILNEQGYYSESRDILNGFLSQISAFVDVENFPAHLEALKYYDRMSRQDKYEVIVPQRDIEIPITFEETGRGYTMYVPVKINGKEYNFIFDTGAASTYISKDFADEIGVSVTVDSIEITGIEKEFGEMGIIPEMMVGDILIKNTNTLIGFPNEATDTILRTDAILGMDFIKKVKEVQIYPNEKKLIIPMNKTPLPETGRNLIFYNRQPYINAYTEKGERVILHFDTGNVKSDMHDIYYQKHKAEIDLAGNIEEVRRGGFGGIRYINAYKISTFPLRIGKTDLILEDIDILTEKIGELQTIEDGSLGIDALLSVQKMIINVDNMFVVLDK